MNGSGGYSETGEVVTGNVMGGLKIVMQNLRQQKHDEPSCFVL